MNGRMTKKEKQKAIDALKISVPVRAMTEEEFNDYIQAINQIMDWLEQEPCEDTVSRQAVLDGLASIAKAKAKSDAQKSLMGRIMFFTEKLPSVTPQPKIGHWIEKDGFDGDTYYDCSECGESWTTIEGTPWNNGMNYCPNCGTKMQEVEEIEITVKASLKNFTDFIDNIYKNETISDVLESVISEGIIRRAIEKGLREWCEES